VVGEVLPYLACPHCAADLALAGGMVRCASGHGFDVAKQGYVNLTPGRVTVTGDSKAMVAARADFLAAGHFQPISDAVTAAVTAALRSPGCIADLGAGTGHYLAAVLDAVPDRHGLALEVAKPALRRAARAHPRIGAIGCDTRHRLPLRDGAAAVALTVFAPRNAAETHRVLDPAGALVVVSPTEAHLRELVPALDLLTVDPDKGRRLADGLAPRFELSTQDKVEFAMSLSRNEVELLVAMGPSAWHIGQEALRERVRTLSEPVGVTASVLVSTFHGRSG